MKKINAIIIYIGDKLSWVYLFIVLISVYEVFMRYVFNKPTSLVHDTSLSLAGIIMVYGGLYAYAKDKHISISVISDLLPQKWQKYLDIFIEFIIFSFLLLLCISTFMITKNAVLSFDGHFQLERSGSSWNSVFPGVAKICMSVFISIFTVVSLINLMNKIIIAFKKESK